MIDEPNQKFSYGSLWAAPVFKAISERVLDYLNVAPDREKRIEKSPIANKNPAQKPKDGLKPKRL
jgi:hypothetical protein